MASGWRLLATRADAGRHALAGYRRLDAGEWLPARATRVSSRGSYELRAREDVDSVLGSESTAEVDESLAVDLTLSAGDVEVHHPNIIHGSNANTSPKRRCGLTIRYIPTSTRITSSEQPFPSAMLLRGKAGANVYQPWPEPIAEQNFGGLG
jgi:phytanoyl-CoA hydroxylase